MRISLFVLLSAAHAVAAPPAPQAGPRYFSPAQMMKLLEESPRQYEIKTEPNPYAQWAQQNATLAWPEAHPPIPIPVLKKKADGSSSIELFERSPEVDTLLDKVEPLFEAKDYPAAEKGYAEILAKYPDDYALTLDWGDAGFYESRKKGEPKDPIVDQFLAATKAGLFNGYVHYEIASRIEPHAYLMQKPETQRAIEEYVRKFVLVPAP